jgi:CheY-like chemotaxis protein
VVVEVVRAASHIQFTVTDSGQGITAEFLPFVFERFRQADSTVARMHGGLGLGLAIVRHLAELHGGTVWADSQGTDLGATFNVRLPIQMVHSSRASAEDETAPLTEHENPRFECPAALKGLRVLIVDDASDSLELITTVLRECGAETVTATSAAQGLESVTSNPPDVLISDIEMPNEDGYSLIRKIRLLPSLKAQEILAVAVTAHANKEDRARALAAGFQIHIRKPVDPSELVEAISQLVEDNQK